MYSSLSICATFNCFNQNQKYQFHQYNLPLLLITVLLISIILMFSGRKMMEKEVSTNSIKVARKSPRKGHDANELATVVLTNIQLIG